LIQLTLPKKMVHFAGSRYVDQVKIVKIYTS